MCFIKFFFYFHFILSPKLKFVFIVFVNDLLCRKERFRVLKKSEKWKEDSYEKEVLIV